MNLIVDSSAQIRLFIPFFSLIVSNFIIVKLIVWQIESGFANLPAETEAVSRFNYFSEIMLKASNIGILGAFFVGTQAILLWLIYSHRIFGPSVSIQRQIKNLCNGNYESQISLRKYDEFKSIADDLNHLANILHQKAGGSPLDRDN